MRFLAESDYLTKMLPSKCHKSYRQIVMGFGAGHKERDVLPQKLLFCIIFVYLVQKTIE